jgi:hypothetical protein
VEHNLHLVLLPDSGWRGEAYPRGEPRTRRIATFGRYLRNALSDELPTVSDGVIPKKKEVEKRDTNGYIDFGFYLGKGA